MPPITRPQADTILGALRERAEAEPEGLAFAIDDGERTSWGALLADVTRLAGRLAASGVDGEEVCALQLPTGLDAIRLVLALQWLGAIPVMVNPALSPEAAARRLAALGYRRVFVPRALPAGTGGGRIDVVAVDEIETFSGPAPAEPRCAAGDVAYLQLTSGTTGEPRAAAITHRNLMAQLRGLHASHRIQTREVLVSWMPLHHDFGLVLFVFGSVYFGRPAHLLQPNLGSLRRWLKTVSRVRGTITASPDFGFRLAARAVNPRGLDLSSLRIAADGGEPVRRTTIEAFERRFSVPGVVRPCYGLGEATLAVTSRLAGHELRTDADGNVSCGTPLPGIEVRIAGDGGRPAPPGETGEIQVRGDTVFTGYWRDPAATRDVLRGGWLATGDLGSLDADGQLYVSGRRRAMIKRAGALVPARVVEEVVDAIGGIRLSAAIGRATEAGTEDVVVVAETNGQILAEPRRRTELGRAIETGVRRALGFAPRDVVLVPPRTIPRTANGKLRHGKLQELYRSGRLAAPL